MNKLISKKDKLDKLKIDLEKKERGKYQILLNNHKSISMHMEKISPLKKHKKCFLIESSLKIIKIS